MKNILIAFWTFLMLLSVACSAKEANDQYSSDEHSKAHTTATIITTTAEYTKETPDTQLSSVKTTTDETKIVTSNSETSAATTASTTSPQTTVTSVPDVSDESSETVYPAVERHATELGDNEIIYFELVADGGTYWRGDRPEHIYNGKVVFSNGECYTLAFDSLDDDLSNINNIASFYRNLDETYDLIHKLVSENELTYVKTFDEDTLNMLYSLICSCSEDENLMPENYSVAMYCESSVIICFKMSGDGSIQPIHIKTDGGCVYSYDDVYRDEIVNFF